MGFCEFNVSPVYTVSFRIANTMWESLSLKTGGGRWVGGWRT